MREQEIGDDKSLTDQECLLSEFKSANWKILYVFKCVVDKLDIQSTLERYLFEGFELYVHNIWQISQYVHNIS